MQKKRYSNQLRRTFNKHTPLNNNLLNKSHISQRPSITHQDKNLINKTFTGANPENFKTENVTPFNSKRGSFKLRKKIPFENASSQYSSFTTKNRPKNEQNLNSSLVITDKNKNFNRTSVNFTKTIENTKNKFGKRFSKINEEPVYNRKRTIDINYKHDKNIKGNINNNISKNNNSIINSKKNTNNNKNNNLFGRSSINSKVSYSTTNTNNTNNYPINRKPKKSKNYNQKAKNFINKYKNNHNNTYKKFLNLKKNEFTFGRLQNLQKLIKKESAVKELCK